MKKSIIISLLLLTTVFTSFAQEHKRIQAYKVAHFTEALSLTPKEAEQFWPVYNKFEKDLRQYKVKDRKQFISTIREKGGIDQLSDTEANKMLDEILVLRDAIHQTEIDKYKALAKVLSAKKMLKLYKAEQAFKKKLINKLKDKRRRKR